MPGTEVALFPDVDNWQVALLTVGALVAGLAIPALWQLRETLKGFAALATKLEPVVDDARVTMGRISRVTASFEGREQTVAELVESMGELAATMNRLRDTTRTATAVGAAVAAAVRAFRDVRAYEPMPDDAFEDIAAEQAAEARVEPTPAEVDGGNGHARGVEEEQREEATS